MAKKKIQPTRTKLEEFNDQLSGVEQKFEKNRKKIYTIIGCVIAVALGIWAYMAFIAGPNEEKAQEAIGKADILNMQQQDSLALLEYEKVIKKFGGDQANRAELEVAVLLVKKGDYDKAIKHLEKFDPKGNVIGPLSQSLLGDCYASLAKPNLDKALKAYEKAVSMSNDNENLTPYFMKKKASVLRAQGKYADEAKVYKEIKEKFMSYAMQNGIDKNIERAEAQAAGK